MRYFYSLSLVFFSLWATAQDFYSVSAKFLQHDLQAYTQGGEVPQSLQKRYALQERAGVYYVGAIAKVRSEVLSEEELLRHGIIVNSRFEGIYTLQIPLGALPHLENISGLQHIDMGHSEEPLVVRAVADVYADSAKAGLGLPAAVSGKDVIVAVIDWGFDFTHPNFYDDSLQELRIRRVWDQNQVAGTPPAGYSYGSEYATEADILAAEHDDPYTFGLGSHGTHTTGIAAGAGAGTILQGVAHEADIVMIPYLRQASSLLDALTYVRDFAAAENKPFVFNMSTGSHLGPHDGTSLKNQAISQTVGVGKVFVGSAGNNGNSPFHLMHQFSNNEWVSSEAQGPFQLRADAWGQTFSIWGSPMEPMTAAFSLVNAAGDTLWTSPHFHSVQTPSADTVILFNGDSLYYRLQSIARDPSNDKPNLRLEVRNRTPLRLALHLRAQQGRVDVWHNVRLPLRYTNWGLRLESRNRAGWLDGDTDYGVGEPSGVGPDVITVGAYRSEERLPNGNSRFGDIAAFSSFGPTVDGRVKPDITAPGVAMGSSVSSFDPDMSGRYSPTNFNGRTYHFASFSGTSMSGPMVCGTTALMLEVNPFLSAHDIRAIMRSTARQDDFTGSLPASGHNRWGWGKLDAWAAVNEAFNRIGVHNYSIAPALALYPNPAREAVQFRLSDSYKEVSLLLQNVQGQTLRQEKFSPQGEGVYQFSVAQLPPGVYLIRVLANASLVGQSRLIIRR